MKPPSKTVTVDGRKFIVDFNEAGEPVRIKERKTHGTGKPWECLYNAPYWNAKHHKLGGPDTLPMRILAAAKGA